MISICHGGTIFGQKSKGYAIRNRPIHSPVMPRGPRLHTSRACSAPLRESAPTHPATPASPAPAPPTSDHERCSRRAIAHPSPAAPAFLLDARTANDRRLRSSPAHGHDHGHGHESVYLLVPAASAPEP